MTDSSRLLQDRPVQEHYKPDLSQEPIKPVVPDAVARAKQRAGEFVREMRYKTLLQGGLNPAQAAKMMGLKVKTGESFRGADILKMIVKGRKNIEK